MNHWGLKSKQVDIFPWLDARSWELIGQNQSTDIRKWVWGFNKKFKQGRHCEGWRESSLNKSWRILVASHKSRACLKMQSEYANDELHTHINIERHRLEVSKMIFRLYLQPTSQGIFLQMITSHWYFLISIEQTRLSWGRNSYFECVSRRSSRYSF